MIYIIEWLIVVGLFSLYDNLNEKKNKIQIVKKIVFRGIITTILSIPIYYFTNQSLIINSISGKNQILISFSILLIINLVITLVSKRKETSFTKIMIPIMKMLLVVLTLELTIFNYQHYLTLHNKENKIEKIELINLGFKNNKYTALEKGKIGFKIKLSNHDLKSLYFPIQNIDNKLVTYTIKVYDKESDSYVTYNKTSSYQGISKTYYKLINNTVDTDILLLEITEDTDSIFALNQVKINPVIPLQFSYVRVLFLLAILILVFLFQPKSFLYQIKFTSKLGKTIVGLFLIFSIVIVTLLANLNPVFRKNNSYKYLYPLISVNEYQKLTESLTKGKFYLEEKPSPILQEMKNPYNPLERSRKFNNTKENYLWDVAYYKGRYYVYFGIVPVVTTYLPYYIITGNHIDNNVVNLIATIGIILAFVSLLKTIMINYFKNENLGILLLLSIFGLFANHFMILYIARRPDFYTVPVSYALLFSLLGLNLWMKSKKKEHLHKGYLFLGSLCMALVSGCRPQFLLISFSAIFLFWDSFKKKQIFSKKTIKESLAFILPYIVIAIMIMGYNYIRFESIFDFGANYNLTTNDMTARGFHFERFLSAIYYYFLAIPKFTNIFPFIELLPLKTSYIGVTIYEKTFGGALMLCPILLLSIFFYRWKKELKKRKLYGLVAMFSISAIIIALVDSQMSGILPRYFLDFNWLLVLSAVIILLTIIQKYHQDKIYPKILNIFSKLICALILFNFFLCFIDVSFSYQEILPTLFYKFYYLIGFWL